ncbi:S-layer homology domain-containing protein [Nodosilinea sp. LEGE 07088]|uniref:S-layer homology domain-containing protein n=1 Tax=Nodosilinea sp. LEGE 07088 TaxID=2777968 RepID=UPI0018820AE5|nr:S-layer homology domain-containing protein [Nodosilinea sp. LEGE 07088]MBE9138430.1 S-layer homology domain-containing protein [Nodosilinea sp. LEGE 07088]
MVNLPPEQPHPTTQPDSGRRDQILDFDELLALVLAFLGIGSILWWGLSRGQGLLAEADLVPRRGGDLPSLALPTPADTSAGVEPRTFDDRDRSQSDPVNREGGFPSFDDQASASDSAAPTVRVVVPASPVPTAPTTAPASPSQEATETTQPLDISDVPTTHWAYPFIKPMFDAGYLPDFPESGFQPDEPLTRAELAALLSQAFGDAPREGSVQTFTDVSSDYWAAPAIGSALSQGFMNGYPEGDFRPEQAVPRYEVIVSLATGIDLAPSPTSEQTLQSFTDLGALPGWAAPKVAAATENALVVNYPTRDQLKPAQAATRAEIVAMIHQALVQQGKLPPVQSAYTVP